MLCMLRHATPRYATQGGAVERAPLSQGDTYSVPRGLFHRLVEATADLEVVRFEIHDY